MGNRGVPPVTFAVPTPGPGALHGPSTHHLRQDHAGARASAQAKAEKRAERAAETDEELVERSPSTTRATCWPAKLHEAYDEQIDFDTFEERRAELMSRARID